MSAVAVRPMKKSDRVAIAALLDRVVEFTKAERACALELFDCAAGGGNNDEDYAFLCAEDGRGELVGFICYGKTPLTRAAYDLYWIVTDPSSRRGGVGRLLLKRCEEILGENEMNLLIAETSSLAAYEKARRFYVRQGFREESRIRDYYAPGDDRLIYCKRYVRAAAGAESPSRTPVEGGETLEGRRTHCNPE